MKRLLSYKPRLAFTEKNLTLAGTKKFSHFFKIYGYDVMPIDRSETFQIPIMVKNLFPIPKFRVFTKSFEEICNERAIYLLKKAEDMGVKLYIFYSGGIDSTLILVSLLKNSSEIQRKNIVVLLSENSINENPNFFRDHITGHLQVASSHDFHNLLGTKGLFVTGENNDQIFGADIIGQYINIFGSESVHEKYDREKMIDFYCHRDPDREMNIFFVDLFERLAKNAPVKIETNYHFLWWINFSLKWQSVFMRILPYISERNIHKIDSNYFDKYYCTFYNTEEFQLWSMNNLDKRIKTDWKTYKYICKDIIYDFNKDSDYRENKTKVGSLYKIMQGGDAFNFIDEDFKFYKDLSVEEYHNPLNDFV